MTRELMTKRDFALIDRAPHYHAIADIALSILARVPKEYEIGIVCGPISTGGLGSLEANITQFNRAISTLQGLGYVIFDQMVFEKRIEALLVPDETGYDHYILHHFYDPIFKSGMIGRKFFIPGWECSIGARWEHTHALAHSMRITYLDHELRPLE